MTNYDETCNKNPLLSKYLETYPNLTSKKIPLFFLLNLKKFPTCLVISPIPQSDLT